MIFFDDVPAFKCWRLISCREGMYKTRISFVSPRLHEKPKALIYKRCIKINVKKANVKPLGHQGVSLWFSS